jgi:hypothetical protein
MAITEFHNQYTSPSLISTNKEGNRKIFIITETKKVLGNEWLGER